MHSSGNLPRLCGLDEVSDEVCEEIADMTMRQDRRRNRTNREVYEHIKAQWRKTRVKHFSHKGVHGTKKKKRQMPNPKCFK
jgi:hypothetical protein